MAAANINVNKQTVLQLLTSGQETALTIFNTLIYCTRFEKY